MDLSYEIWKIFNVLREKSYAFIFVAITVSAFTAYALLLNYQLLFSIVSAGELHLLLDMVPKLTAGYIQTTTNFSLFMTTVISIAIGVNFALIVFRLVEQASFGREGAGTLGGMAVAVLAPACPACATALFAVAGVSSAFAVLPFRGTEIKVLALLMLIGSAVWISSQIDEEACELC